MPVSFWVRYKSAIDFKQDLKEVYIRPHKRYATLDGARAITILLMVLFHVLFGIIVLFDNDFVKIDRFIQGFPDYFGWMWQSQGSDPLFVMCGLLVAYSLFREVEHTDGIQIWRFYKRRLMRILPLYFLALLLYGLADIGGLADLWSNLLFASNYIEGQRHIVPVAWSLDVQMQFYLVLPFLVLLMFRSKRPILILVLLTLASLAWRYWVVLRDPVIYETPFYEIIYDGDFGSLLANELYYDIGVRIGAFFMGMLVAYLHHFHGKQMQAFFSRHLVINTLLVIGGMAMIALSLGFPVEDRTAPMYENFNPVYNLLFLAFDRYLYSFGLSMLVMMALCPVGVGRWVTWVLSWPIWHPVAQLIFSIYLFHFIFIVVAAVIVFQTTDRESIEVVATWQVFLIYFWAMVLTMAFGTLMHIFIEKPFLTMREHKPVKTAESATSASAA